MRTPTLTLAAGLTMLASTVLAQPPFDRMGPPPGMDGGAGRALALLLRPDSLTDAQQQEVRSIMEADRKAVQDTLEKLRAANDTMATALLGDSAPTTESLAAVTEQIAALRKTLLAQQVDTALAVRTVLTPEQLAEADARQQQLAASDADRPFMAHP